MGNDTKALACLVRSLMIDLSNHVDRCPRCNMGMASVPGQEWVRRCKDCNWPQGGIDEAFSIERSRAVSDE